MSSIFELPVAAIINQAQQAKRTIVSITQNDRVDHLSVRVIECRQGIGSAIFQKGSTQVTRIDDGLTIGVDPVGYMGCAALIKEQAHPAMSPADPWSIIGFSNAPCKKSICDKPIVFHIVNRMNASMGVSVNHPAFAHASSLARFSSTIQLTRDRPV